MQWFGATAIGCAHRRSARHEVARDLGLMSCCGDVKRGIARVDVMLDRLEVE
jgi:hypothetical protein